MEGRENEIEKKINIVSLIIVWIINLVKWLLVTDLRYFGNCLVV